MENQYQRVWIGEKEKENESESESELPGEREGEDALKREAVGGSIRGDKRRSHEALHEIDLLGPRKSGASG